MSLVDTITRVVESVVDRILADRVLGLATAEVSSIDEEGAVLRYKSLNLDQGSPPARVAVPMAGGGRGAYFRPEPGDEVIVAFENGDISQPVIIGSTWNPDQTPPSQADTSASNNIRAIVSRAGHQITLDDTPGGGGISVRSASGVRIQIDDATGRVTIETTGRIADSTIVLDGVSWNHQHATGVGPSGPPVSIVPPPPEAP